MLSDPDFAKPDFVVPDLEPFFQREPIGVTIENIDMPKSQRADRWSKMKPQDDRPQRGGWAPGQYVFIKCRTCDCVFQGDKRAHECADCAYARPDFHDLPRLVALCGNPRAGKSETQKILEDYGYQPADDAWPVRDFAIRHFGLSLEDVTTQSGKDGMTEVCGIPMQVREVLGKAANSLEREFGEDIMAWLAVQGLRPDTHYSFGSVRRQQGKVYKQLGGVIIGVRRPGADRSPYEFDSFDESVVDHWIDNDGPIEALREKVADLMWLLSGERQAA